MQRLFAYLLLALAPYLTQASFMAKTAPPPEPAAIPWRMVPPNWQKGGYVEVLPAAKRSAEKPVRRSSARYLF